MGGKKKPTIGHWYKVLYHLGICRGPVDALLEFRGGDKVAWQGEQTTSGIISIDALNLWGGEKKEGGIQGDLHVMMGEAAQTPNSMLASVLGPEQSAYRGRTTMAFNGRYGAFNPYPKPPWFKMRRILKGWDDDVCWYPEKAGILMDSQIIPPSALWGYINVGAGDATNYSEVELSSLDQAQAPFGSADYSMQTRLPSDDGFSNLPNTALTIDAVVWYRNDFYFTGQADIAFECFVDDGFTLYVNGDVVFTQANPSNWGYAIVTVPKENLLNGWNRFAFRCTDSNLGGADSYFDAKISAPGTVNLVGMNPAHILYDSLTSKDMKGEPVELINSASFAAAADTFFDEGFGLCTQYDAGSESVEQFQQRILNVVGANMSQSRTDGLYYLTPTRGVHDLGSLQILTDDDILEYAEEPSDPLESVNQVAVEWFDQATRAKKTTTPMQSLGAIQAVGAVLADTSQYPEIPSESLALRVGARDLNEKSQPRKRFTLTTTRVAYAWRAGQFFRLQAPRRGIADMICMVGDIGAGVRRSGSIRLRALQDVSSMPLTTYATAEPGIDTTPSATPSLPPAQGAMEAPYFELVTSIPPAELAALAPDAGFLAVFAARPTSGVNFDLWTKTGAEEYQDRGDGDWCPYATIVEAANQTATALTLASAQDLSNVLVGQAALWDGEIVRVDAINPIALTITLARGCADTPPIDHLAGQAILFFDGFTASDEREYSDGELVNAKLLPRTSSALYPIAGATALAVTMDSRQARPYPPGKLRITDALLSSVAYPLSAIGTLTATWTHRDRLLQEDQVVDESAASVGPEAGTTYNVRYYLDAVLLHTESSIAGTSATPYILASSGTVKIEVEAARAGLVSRTPATAQFAYSPIEKRITDSLDTRIIDSGDRRITD